MTDFQVQLLPVAVFTEVVAREHYDKTALFEWVKKRKKACSKKGLNALSLVVSLIKLQLVNTSRKNFQPRF